MNKKRLLIENPAAILTLSNEELMQYWWETKEDEDKLALEQEQIMATKSAIKEECIARAHKIHRDGFVASETQVTVYRKVYANKVTLETAREMGAVKMREVVDSGKITKLLDAGAKIEGAEERTEVRITKIKQESEGA